MADDLTPLAVLATLLPWDTLDGSAQEVLLKRSTLVEMPAGTPIIAADTAPWALFLVEGRLRIESERGTHETVIATTDRARQPLFRIHPPTLRAVAVSRCRLLRTDRMLYELIERGRVTAAPDPAPRPITVVAEPRAVPVTPRGQRCRDCMLEELYTALEQGRLHLPELPPLARRLREAADADAPQFAAWVAQEPVVAQGVVEVAGLLYGGAPDLPAASGRLGAADLRDLVTALSLRELFVARSGEYRELVQRLYAVGANVAAFACVIARHVAGLSPERALLAGLVSDLGLLPAIRYMDTDADLLLRAELVETSLATLRRSLAVRVVESLGLGPDLVTVVREAGNLRRDPAEGGADYCDVVIAARVQARLCTPAADRLPPLTEVPALRRIAPEAVDPGRGLAFVADQAEMLAGLAKVLR